MKETRDEQNKQSGEQSGLSGGLVSRRKLLASLGMAGAAIATSGILNVGALGTAYGAPEEKGRIKIKDLLTASAYVIPVTIAELRADPSPLTDFVYYIVDSGHEGHFVHDPAETSADNTGTILVAASGERFKRIIETSYINVKWFGAKGDGTTDNSVSINKANQVATDLHAPLYFPAGTYMGFALYPTTSWFSDQQAVIKSAVRKYMPDPYLFVRVENVSYLSFEGLTFDGNVSDDPVSWNSSNYDNWIGCIGLYVVHSHHITIKNCTFQNSFRCTLQLDGTYEVLVQHCTMKRARGNFGDGVYVAVSNHIRFENCSAEDYTRIGYVTEPHCHTISFTHCYAGNGHDSSIFYGGPEYNAGFWSENSAHVTFSHCVAENNSSMGFVCSTGSLSPTVTATASFVYDSCLAFNNPEYSFAIGTYWNPPIAVSCTNCHSYGSVRGFHIVARSDNDVFNLTDCYVHMSMDDPAKDHYAPFIVNIDTGSISPTINVTNCVCNWGTVDMSRFQSTTDATADFTFYNAAKAVVTIDNLVSSNKAVGAVLKSLDGQPTLRVRNSTLAVTTIRDYVEMQFDQCTFTSMSHQLGNWYYWTSGRSVQLSHCDIFGRMEIYVNGRMRFHHVRAKLSGTQSIEIARAVNDRAILSEFVDCSFEKDVDVSAHVIRITENSSTKPSNLFQNCRFYNTNDAVTTTRSFVWLENDGTSSLFAGCFSDNTVTYPLKVGSSFSAPTGNTLILMH